MKAPGPSAGLAAGDRPPEWQFAPKRAHTDLAPSRLTKAESWKGQGIWSLCGCQGLSARFLADTEQLPGQRGPSALRGLFCGNE